MNPPNLPSFFKSKGPKSFNFRPRYYDQLKEEREARNRQIEREVRGGNGDVDLEAFRGRLRDRWQNSAAPRQNGGASLTRLFLISGCLALIAYYILH